MRFKLSRARIHAIRKFSPRSSTGDQGQHSLTMHHKLFSALYLLLARSACARHGIAFHYLPSIEYLHELRCVVPVLHLIYMYIFLAHSECPIPVVDLNFYRPRPIHTPMRFDVSLLPCPASVIGIESANILSNSRVYMPSQVSPFPVPS
jgi:hypothetical protein